MASQPMKSRQIRPEMFDNEILGTADPLVTILFQCLWCMADREGRFEWREKRIKARAFPYRDCDVSPLLAFLCENRLVVKYHSGGEVFGFIPKFSKHQNINGHEAKSVLPAPPSNADASTCMEKQSVSGEWVEVEVKEEVKVKVEVKEEAQADAPPKPITPPEPLKQFGKFLRMTEREHQTLVDLFGETILNQEIPEMDVWIENSKSPTAAKYRRPEHNHYLFARTTWLPGKKLRPLMEINGRGKFIHNTTAAERRAAEAKKAFQQVLDEETKNEAARNSSNAACVPSVLADLRRKG